MRTLIEVFDNCEWEQKFEHSTPSTFDEVFETGEALEEFLEDHEEEEEEGFWKLHLGSWSNGAKAVVEFIEYE